MRVLTHRLVWLAVLVAWGAGIGHAQTQKPAQPVTSKPKPKPVPAKPVGTMTAVELDAAKYIADSTKIRVPYRLNLGDERQYNYVLAMLRLAGDSPQRSPQLYKNLAAARASGKAGPPELAMGPKEGEGGQNTTLITSLNLIEYVYDDDVNATGGLLSSVPGGTDNTTMLVNYRVANQTTPFAFSPLYKQSGGGKQFLQQFVAALPSGQQTANVVASSLILTSKGGVTTPYTMLLDDGTPNATSICVTAPNYVKQQVPPIQCPAVGATCINNGPITTNILSCYGRNQADCSYAWGGPGYPPSMTLAIAGSMTFPGPVDPSLTGTFLLNLQRSDGGCWLPPGGGETLPLNPTNFSISKTDPNTLNFCFPGAQFQNSGCLSTVTGNLFVDLTVYATLDVSGPNFGMGKVTSDPANNPHQPYWAQIPVITVLQGCFAPGTDITLADGTTRKVESFKGDGSETVLLDAKGTTGKIVGTGDGIEMLPMIRITDSAGNAVTVTESHPIVTGRGPKMAWQVRVGDALRTRKGTTKVAKIDSVPAAKDQRVHNLFIGDMKQAEAGKTTMFANGIQVGDMYMQNALFQQSKKQGFTQAEVLGRLPKEWHQDYLNSVKYGTDRK